jgi:hypothetical protein
MIQRPKKWTNASLEDSVRECGLMLPVYEYPQGVVIDGERRKALAVMLGKPFQVVILPSEQAALRLLWELHPDRAAERMGEGTLTTYAKALGLPLSEVSPTLAVLRGYASKPKRETRKQRERWNGAGPVLLQLWLCSSFRATLQVASTRDAKSIAEYCRKAIWQSMTRTLTKQEIKKLWNEYRALDASGAVTDEMDRLVAQLVSNP